MAKDTDSEWTDLASEDHDSAPTPDADDTDTAESSHDEPSLRRDFMGVDPSDASGLERALEAALTRLTDDHSELAKVKLLPYAKTLYEELHPETKHGGVREGQVAGSATWPRFASYAAQRSGFSERSIYNRLKAAEQLETLDEKTEKDCYGSPLANQISLLARIARLPKGTLQRDVVGIYNRGARKEAKAELQRWEDEFEIAKKPSTRSKRQPNEANPAAADTTIPIADLSTDEVAKIIQALGVSCIEGCVPAIESLKMAASSTEQRHPHQSTIQELQERLAAAEVKATNLSQELKAYRAAPLGKLYQILGVRDAKGALEKARALITASDGSVRVASE